MRLETSPMEGLVRAVLPERRSWRPAFHNITWVDRDRPGMQWKETMAVVLTETHWLWTRSRRYRIVQGDISMGKKYGETNYRAACIAWCAGGPMPTQLKELHG